MKARLLMNMRVNSKTTHAAQVEPVTFADMCNPNQRRIAAGAAQDCSHLVPVKQLFADRSHCAAAPAGRLRGRHLKRKNFVQQSACRVAVQSQIVIVHTAQSPVGPNRSVLMRSGS
jgi:hypothetical protein